MGNQYAKLEKKVDEGHMAAQRHWAKIAEVMANRETQRLAEKLETDRLINLQRDDINKLTKAVSKVNNNINGVGL